jgi:hypothetical protein
MHTQNKKITSEDEAHSPQNARKLQESKKASPTPVSRREVHQKKLSFTEVS